ncbi:hypothetical protein HHK36_027523 [Tetracentron sinense]|uniref:Uncharacterized protein n=1 Tax=Tetracentron sinense TaxID=13715 RepID=A0A835D4H8_TETSI|nr:hypothetical protein HHK36_027523 [Tetracentron sinense]
MSSTLLEARRAAHEEVERFERFIVKDLQREPGSNRERLWQNHRVRNMIDSITSITEKLVEIYEDKDSARKDKIAAFGGQTATGTNVFSAFYDRLKEIREYHRRHLVAHVVDAAEEYEELLKEEPCIEFSGEADDKVQGWESNGHDNGHISYQDSVIDLDYYSTVEELIEVGPEKLKEEEVQSDTENDEDEQQIYNPLKLPMGWDGKHIPYWLYKLHGLGQEFKCEICGNHSYWGHRAFERHFKEWCYQHGMRCLDLLMRTDLLSPKDISPVLLYWPLEAKVLWERIQEQQGVNKWHPELEEEYEDKEGNIYNKKTYTDPQRPGLI